MYVHMHDYTYVYVCMYVYDNYLEPLDERSTHLHTLRNIH